MLYGRAVNWLTAQQSSNSRQSGWQKQDGAVATATGVAAAGATEIGASGGVSESGGPMGVFGESSLYKPKPVDGAVLQECYESDAGM
jgi:hypothetical protein